VSLSSLPPSGGHPARLPERFVDRSLGRVQVPRILRAAGLRLMTLAERYGRPADESVTDVEWLEEAGRRDWVVMKDERIPPPRRREGSTSDSTRPVLCDHAWDYESSKCPAFPG
jgi:PIN like domain